MRICFYASDKPREQQLAKAFLHGAKHHGHEGWVKPLTPEIEVEHCDVACMVGVKSARLFNAVRKRGIVPVYLDKGYIRDRRVDARTWEFWRVAVNSHHPTDRLMDRKMPDNRAQDLGLQVKPWRNTGLQIVFAGSSAKYHEFYGLPEPTKYAKEMIAKIRKLTDRPIVYRPKPSWRDARPIAGTTWSGPKESLLAVMTNAHCLVTHGSNACFEAALWGIPTVALGPAVARPISSTQLEDVLSPKTGKREQWLNNLAYYQWTEAEMSSGEAWQYIGEWVDDAKQSLS